MNHGDKVLSKSECHWKWVLDYDTLGQAEDQDSEAGHGNVCGGRLPCRGSSRARMYVAVVSIHVPDIQSRVVLTNHV